MFAWNYFSQNLLLGGEDDATSTGSHKFIDHRRLSNRFSLNSIPEPTSGRRLVEDDRHPKNYLKRKKDNSWESIDRRLKIIVVNSKNLRFYCLNYMLWLLSSNQAVVDERWCLSRRDLWWGREVKFRKFPWIRKFNDTKRSPKSIDEKPRRRGLGLLATDH